MDHREFTDNLTKMLGTTYHTFADPVNEKLIKFKDAEYRMTALGKLVHNLYLTLAIATPLAFGYTINQISNDIPKNSYERIVDK